MNLVLSGSKAWSREPHCVPNTNQQPNQSEPHLSSKGCFQPSRHPTLAHSPLSCTCAGLQVHGSTESSPAAGSCLSLSSTGAPACEWFQPTFVASLLKGLTQLGIPAKQVPSRSPPSICSGRPSLGMPSPLLLANPIQEHSSVRVYPAPWSLSDPRQAELVPPSLGPFLPSSFYCIVLWLVVYVSASLTRL